MTRCTPFVVATLLAAGLLIGAAAATAQDAALERVQAAEDLVREGDFDAASKILNSTLAACGADDDACKIRVETSLGWLAARRADAAPDEAAPEEADRWRAVAVIHYHRALALRPEHPRLRSNLVLALEAAGRQDDAARVATELARDDSPEALILLGDLYRRQGDARAAREAYFRAESARAEGAAKGNEGLEEEELHRRLLATYRMQPGESKEHKAWCERLWKQGEHALASQGLEELAVAADGETAGWALVHWANQSLAAESLTLDAVTRLAESLPGDSAAKAPAQQLARLLTSLEADAAPWWTEHELASHVAARALGRRSHDLEARGEAKAAADALELARRIAPAPEEYESSEELAGRTPVWMDLTTELAALYGRSGDERGFSDLEDELFATHRSLGIRRGDAETGFPGLAQGLLGTQSLGYLKGDLASVHRLHTVLGQIYAARGQWQGGRFTNAVFQLDRALSTAAELASQDDREPPPLPHLRLQLAKGQEVLGDAAAASASYRTAAMEYLRLDEPRAGLEAATAARQLTADDSSLGALETIARTRIALTDVGTDNRIDAEAVERSTWLADAGPGVDLPESFVKDQQFKVWSDLAELAARRDRADLALQYQLEALTVVPDASSLHRGDRLRVEQLKKSIETEAFDPGRLAVGEESLRLKLETEGHSDGKMEGQS